MAEQGLLEIRGAVEEYANAYQFVLNKQKDK
jgi:hypothetical protein